MTKEESLKPWDALELHRQRETLICFERRAEYWKAEHNAANEIIKELVILLNRYRNETPLGHQPHMIAHLADEAITKAGKFK